MDGSTGCLISFTLRGVPARTMSDDVVGQGMADWALLMGMRP
jgi:hypothetical protein